MLRPCYNRLLDSQLGKRLCSQGSDRWPQIIQVEVSGRVTQGAVTVARSALEHGYPCIQSRPGKGVHQVFR